MSKTAVEILEHQIEYFKTHDLAREGAGGCYYASHDNDRRCAVGCLVPDEALEDEETKKMLVGLSPVSIGGIINGAKMNVQHSDLNYRDNLKKNGEKLFELMDIDLNDDHVCSILRYSQDYHDNAQNVESLVDSLNDLLVGEKAIEEATK